MGDGQAFGVFGAVVLLVMLAFLSLYTWSLIKHHDNEAERVLGIVMLTKIAPAILCVVALISLGIVLALT